MNYQNLYNSSGTFEDEGAGIEGNILLGTPIYPEFSVNWIIDEVLHFPFEERAHDRFYIRNDEDRKEIGTLKALGFSNKAIEVSYLLYAFFATLFGSVLGTTLGFLVVPRQIWRSISIIIDIPTYTIKYSFSHIIMGYIIAFICAFLITKISTKKTLKETVPELSKAKSVNYKSRLIVEKIPVLNNLLTFQTKIIFRNMLSYKKKMIMTFIGIFGSALLILIAFSLQYSIAGIAEMQFGKIFDIDYMITVDENASSERITEIASMDGIKTYQKMRSFSALADKNSISIRALEEPYNDIINLLDYQTGEKLGLEDGKVIVSEKLARIMNKKVGDSIDLQMLDNSTKSFEISGITENYWEHNVYMNVNTYEKNYGTYKTNLVCIKLNENVNSEEMKTKLINTEEVQLVVAIEDAMQSVSNKLAALNRIVALQTIFSGALSILILYNIAAFNISERRKEIKTIKTLGFTNREVNNYIVNETTILCTMGIIAALILGKPMALFVIKRVEIQIARYMYTMKIQSYLYTVLITSAFLIITNMLTRKYLKHIKIKD